VNDGGIPGTEHVNWDEVFKALSEIGYDRWLVIESFTPEIKEAAASTATWREPAPSTDVIAKEGLEFLRVKARSFFEIKPFRAFTNKNFSPIFILN